MIEYVKKREARFIEQTSESSVLNFCTIGDIVDLQSGVAFKKAEYSTEGVRLFQIANVSFNFIKWEEVEYLPEEYVNKYPELLLKAGDIVMALNRPLLNDKLKVAEINKSDTPTILYQRVGRFKFLNECNPRYFLYFLQSPAFINWLKEQLQGVNIPFINKSKLLGFDRFPNRNRKDQDHIVAKIEELFSELDKTIEQLKTAQQQLKVYRQSVLKWAFEGRLANEKETEIQASLSWKEYTLQQLCEEERSISYGVIKLGEHLDNGVPCLRTSDVKPLKFDLKDVKHISNKLSENYKRTILQGGEVLVNIRGTLGGVAVVPETMRGWNISREIAVLPLTEKVNPFFLAYQIASPRCQAILKKSTKGIAYLGINLSDLRNLKILIPDEHEQLKIVQDIERRFSVADKVEETIVNSLEQAEELRQSILKKAFEGKLI